MKLLVLITFMVSSNTIVKGVDQNCNCYGFKTRFLLYACCEEFFVSYIYNAGQLVTMYVWINIKKEQCNFCRTFGDSHI